MPYCTKCGALIPPDAAFCQKCGQPQKAVATAAANRPADSGNVAAMLSYALGWVTGLIFLLIDRRPFVRFHAAQSLITFGALHIVRGILGTIFGVGWWIGSFGGTRRFSFGHSVFSLLSLLTIALWLLCMVKAYQGQWFRMPITGDIAEDIVGHQQQVGS